MHGCALLGMRNVSHVTTTTASIAPQCAYYIISYCTLHSPSTLTKLATGNVDKHEYETETMYKKRMDKKDYDNVNDCTKAR